jgi:heat shock protein HslJ
MDVCVCVQNGYANSSKGGVRNMKNIERKKLSVIGIFAFLVFSVSGVEAQRSKLSDTTWQLTHIDGRAVSTNKAFLKFDQNDGRFTGNAGCNRMFGKVEITGRRIDFGNVATTKMACSDPGSTRVERSFVSGLESVKRFRLANANSTLELIGGRHEVLRFKASKVHSAKLESRKWVVEEIAGKPIHIKGEAPFVVFDASKSSAGGNTGCNVFGGSYAVSGQTIRIFDTISTMRACVEDERMAIEREFMGALRKANRFEIKDARLLLYRGEKLLARFNGVAK